MEAANQPVEILALDVGSVRVGVARASSAVQLAEPLTTLTVTQHIYDDIATLCTERAAGQLVIGLPRGLDGQETAQTAAVRKFAADLSQVVSLPMTLQDEALTSHQAEAELGTRGKPYAKTEVDALAACYILEDYLRSGKL